MLGGSYTERIGIRRDAYRTFYDARERCRRTGRRCTFGESGRGVDEIVWGSYLVSVLSLQRKTLLPCAGTLRIRARETQLLAWPRLRSLGQAGFLFGENMYSEQPKTERTDSGWFAKAASSRVV